MPPPWANMKDVARLKVTRARESRQGRPPVGGAVGREVARVVEVGCVGGHPGGHEDIRDGVWWRTSDSASEDTHRRVCLRTSRTRAWQTNERLPEAELAALALTD